MKLFGRFSLLLSVLLLGSACHQKNDRAASDKAAATTAPAEAPPSQQTSASLTAARDSLKQGNVDEAAAKLAQLQVQGASFSAQQAKDYREMLNEVSDRAIEGAQRGDPKAQAALQLLRAARPH